MRTHAAAWDALRRALGPRALLLSDPCALDRWRWVAPRLRRGAVRTLDAGSGGGAFALYAAQLGNDVVGISHDPAENRIARKRAARFGLSRARFVDADLRELAAIAAAWEPFDQILCLETIEHVRDDRALIEALAALLKPGGVLYLTTPSTAARRLYRDRVSPVEDGGHVRAGYSQAELTFLVQQFGLSVIEEAFLSGVVSQQLTNVQRFFTHVGLRRTGLAATAPFRVIQLLDRPLSEVTRHPYRTAAVAAVRASAA